MPNENVIYLPVRNLVIEEYRDVWRYRCGRLIRVREIVRTIGGRRDEKICLSSRRSQSS